MNSKLYYICVQSGTNFTDLNILSMPDGTPSESYLKFTSYKEAKKCFDDIKNVIKHYKPNFEFKN